ncbi:hypothetical protein FB107DRAFT_220534 [Schizophyllum commune]
MAPGSNFAAPCGCDVSWHPEPGRPILIEPRVGDILGTREPFLTALKPFVEDFVRLDAGLPVADEEKSHLLTLIRSLCSGLTRTKLIEEGTVYSSHVSHFSKERPCLVLQASEQAHDFFVCLMGSFEQSWVLPPVLQKLGTIPIPVATPNAVCAQGGIPKAHVHTHPPWRNEPQWLLAMSIRVRHDALSPFPHHQLRIPANHCPFVDDATTGDLLELCSRNLYALITMQQDPRIREKLARELLNQTNIVGHPSTHKLMIADAMNSG